MINSGPNAADESRGGALNRRAFLVGGAAMGAYLTLAGCASSPDANGTGSTGSTGSSGEHAQSKLVYAEGAMPDNLDPMSPNQSTPTLGYWNQMYDTLVWREDGEIKPRLATSWETVDDTTWEFKLRKGVKFHNGESFTAESVQFTINRIIDPKEHSFQGARFTDVSKVSVVDDFTVRIETAKPFPVLLFALTQAPILPSKYVRNSGGDAFKHPVGTGPFKFQDWTQGDHITFAANEDYWGGRPKFDTLVMRYIPENATRLAALKAGEIDIAQNISLDDVDNLSTEPGISVSNSFIDEGLIIMFKTIDGGPLANEKVRLALNYAVDKDTINKTLLNGKMRPLDGQLVTKGVLGYNPEVKAFEYDPDKAKALLKEAGYANGFDTELFGPIGKYPGDKDIVVAVADQLNAVGIRAKPTTEEFSIWSKQLVDGTASPMTLVGWYSFGDPALALVWMTSHTTYGVYYKDSHYDELVDKGATTLGDKARTEIYHEVAKYMHDQGMVLFLFQPATYWGVRDRVSGFKPRSDELPDLLSVSVKD